MSITVISYIFLGIISEVLWVWSFGYSCNYNIFFFMFGYFTCHIHHIFGYKRLGIRAFLNIITLSFWVFIFIVYMFHLGIIVNFFILFGYLSLLNIHFIWVITSLLNLFNLTFIRHSILQEIKVDIKYLFIWVFELWDLKSRN